MEIEDNGGKYWERNWEGKRREERKETVMGKCPLYPGYASMSGAGESRPVSCCCRRADAWRSSFVAHK